MSHRSFLSLFAGSFFVAAVAGFSCGGPPEEAPSWPLPVGSSGAGASTGSSTSAGGSQGTGGSTGQGGASSTGTGGSGAGGAIACATSPAPTIEKQGTAGKILLKGTVVTPAQAFDGEVLIDGTTLACVAAGAGCEAQAGTASIVQTNGVILPGLIDAHNHVQYAIFDDADFTPAPTDDFDDHTDWPNVPRMQGIVDSKQFLESGPTATPPGPDLDCELDKYGEIRAIASGVTAVVPHNAELKCQSSLARTLASNYEGFPAWPTDKIKVSSLGATSSTVDSTCTKYADGSYVAWLLHLGEGTPMSAAKNEFASFASWPASGTNPPGCALAPQTAFVHGMSLSDAELGTMGAHGMSLIWSAKSNVFLYGHGTDLTKTANVPVALAKGVNVGVSQDWTIGGSYDMFDELRFDDLVDNTVWGNILTPKDLVTMATLNNAKALHIDSFVGSLEVGKLADVTVIGRACDPYLAVLAAEPKDVVLTIVNGVPLYGDAALKALAPQAPGCEDFDACGTAKFLCVATTTTTDKLGQTLGDIVSAIQAGIQMDDGSTTKSGYKSQDYLPIAPVLKCP